MKKVIIVSGSVLLIICVVIITLNIIATKNEKRHYDSVKESAKEALIWYLNASLEIKVDKEEARSGFTPFSFLVSKGYLKREDIIDINNINYCDGYLTYTIDNKELTCTNVFIKCDNYVSDNYDSNDVEHYYCN